MGKPAMVADAYFLVSSMYSLGEIPVSLFVYLVCAMHACMN